jgi:plastocyanin
MDFSNRSRPAGGNLRPGIAATLRITMENLVISPADASAKVGDTVEWINKDVFVHTATARNGDFDVNMPAKKTVTSVLKRRARQNITAASIPT